MNLNNEQLVAIRKKIMLSFIADDYLSDIFVLKGGNALELIYRITKRPSLDIDFSMEDAFDPGEIPGIKEKIERSLIKEFEHDNIEVFDLKFEEKPPPEKLADPRGGGYRVSFKLIEKKDDYDGMSLDKKRVRALPVSGKGTTFKVDISKYEYCEKKVHKEIDGYTFYVYSPEMIILEKMRAICQQTKEYREQENTSRRPRPRDFYDIFMLCTKMRIKIATPSNREMLQHIFERKNVPLELLKITEKYRSYHKQGFKELLDTLPHREKNITYDEIFDFVKTEMEKIALCAS